MMSWESAASVMKEVVSEASVELLMFFVAFFVHLVVFSKHGLLAKRATNSAAGKTAKSSTTTTKHANLATCLLSLQKVVPDANFDLELTGEESDAEVQELIAANPDTDFEIVKAAVAIKRLSTLRSFLSSYCASTRTGTDSLQVSLLKRLANEGLLTEALACNKIFQSKTIKPFLCSAIAEGPVAKKSIHDLKYVLKETKAHVKRPSYAFFNNMLAATSCDEDLFPVVLHEMKACGFPPNNNSCAVLLKGIQKNTKDSHLEKVMNVMDERISLDVDQALMTALRDACHRSSQEHLMNIYLQKMRDQGADLKVKPAKENNETAHSMSVIIRGYSSVGDLKKVWEVWNDMKQRGKKPSHLILGCMVEALSTNQDPEGAYQIICEALADPETKPLVNAVMYSSVLKTLNQMRQFDRVWSIYEEMLAGNIKFSVSTYNVLLDVCARSCDVTRAEPLLQAMIKEGIQPNLITYGTVIKAYCAEGTIDQALTVMRTMTAVSGLVPDEVIYNTVLDGCARFGNFERGIETLQLMRNANVAPSNFTLSVVAKLANRSKRPEKAFQLVEGLMKEFNVQPNCYVYNNLIQAALFTEDLTKGQEIFAAMLQEKVHPDGRTYTLLLNLCAIQKKMNVAVQILRLAVGLPLNHNQMGVVKSGRWKQDQDILIPPLFAAMARLPSKTWAVAPTRGKETLQHDVVVHTFHLLIQVPEAAGDDGVKALWTEVQKAMPGLKPDSRLTAAFAKAEAQLQ